MKKGTKQDLEMLISDLDNFYSYRGKEFFNLLEESERIDFEDRIYNLYNDLQDKLDEIEKELEQKPIESKDIEVNLNRLENLGVIKQGGESENKTHLHCDLSTDAGLKCGPRRSGKLGARQRRRRGPHGGGRHGRGALLEKRRRIHRLRR